MIDEDNETSSTINSQKKKNLNKSCIFELVPQCKGSPAAFLLLPSLYFLYSILL